MRRAIVVVATVAALVARGGGGAEAARKRRSTTTVPAPRDTTTTLPTKQRVVVIGAAGGDAGEVVARLYEQALLARGYTARVRRGIDGPQALLRLLTDGTVDIATGDLAELVDVLAAGGGAGEGSRNRRQKTPTTSAPPPRSGAPRVVAAFNDLAAGRRLEGLLPTGVATRTSLAVRAAQADELRIVNVADVWRLGRDARLGGPSGCAEADDCARGLRRDFGVRFDEVKEYPSGSAALAALRGNEVDAAVIVGGVTLTVDVRAVGGTDALFPVHPLVPVVRTDRVDADLRAEIDRVSAVLDATGYDNLLRAAAAPNAKKDAVARDWLHRHGLT